MTEDDLIGQQSPGLLELADRVSASLDSWGLRMAEAAAGGRSATTIARMATARTAAELHRLSPPQNAGDQTGSDPLAVAVAEYLRRASSTVSRAAHEIERNRYSLQTMHGQLEKLEDLYRKVRPDTVESSERDGRPEDRDNDLGSAGFASGADDRGSDGEITSR